MKNELTGGSGSRIECYGMSLAGSSHISKGKPCQDAHAYALCDDCVVLAVADGIGSETSSDIGAETAVRACVDYCAEGIRACETDDQCKQLIAASFREAYASVLDKADETGISAGQMDSTLCCVIWDTTTKTAYVGQSGDSGAVCAHQDGTYELLTQKQNDSEGAVYCLCWADHWVFSQMEDVWSLMLCTDGVLDAIVASPFLKLFESEPKINGGRLIDAHKTQAFLHPYLDDNAENPVADLANRARTYLTHYDTDCLSDDKTVLVAFRADELPEYADDSYYKDPDWDEIERRVTALRREETAAEASKPAKQPTKQPTAPAEGDGGEQTMGVVNALGECLAASFRLGGSLGTGLKRYARESAQKEPHARKAQGNAKRPRPTKATRPLSNERRP